MLFRSYETWLSAGGRKHVPEVFLRWVKDHYVDEMGNLRFYLDSINSTRVTQNASTRRRDGYAFQLDRNDFHASGWAFDLRSRRLLKDVVVLLDDRPLTQTRYRRPRPDVADYFRIPELMGAGWEVSADLSGWPRRCYDMRLQLTRLDSRVWQSSPQATICLR